MAEITINVADERLKMLENIAQERGISLEEFLSASVEDWLSHQQRDFSDAAKYVLAKNAELYQRLA